MFRKTQFALSLLLLSLAFSPAQARPLSADLEELYRAFGSTCSGARFSAAQIEALRARVAALRAPVITYVNDTLGEQQAYEAHVQAMIGQISNSEVRGRVDQYFSQVYFKYLTQVAQKSLAYKENDWTVQRSLPLEDAFERIDQDLVQAQKEFSDGVAQNAHPLMLMSRAKDAIGGAGIESVVLAHEYARSTWHKAPQFDIDTLKLESNCFSLVKAIENWMTPQNIVFKFTPFHPEVVNYLTSGARPFRVQCDKSRWRGANAPASDYVLDEENRVIVLRYDDSKPMYDLFVDLHRQLSASK